MLRLGRQTMGGRWCLNTSYIPNLFRTHFMPAYMNINYEVFNQSEGDGVKIA